MNVLKLVLFLFCIFQSALASADSKKVLFVGNYCFDDKKVLRELIQEYTFFNNTCLFFDKGVNAEKVNLETLEREKPQRIIFIQGRNRYWFYNFLNIRSIDDISENIFNNTIHLWKLHANLKINPQLEKTYILNQLSSEVDIYKKYCDVNNCKVDILMPNENFSSAFFYADQYRRNSLIGFFLTWLTPNMTLNNLEFKNAYKNKDVHYYMVNKSDPELEENSLNRKKYFRYLIEEILEH